MKRLFLVLLPVAIAGAVLERIVRETRSMLFLIWCDIRSECAAAKRLWITGETE